MSGSTIAACPRRAFSFGATGTVSLGYFDVSQFREGTLIARIHVNGIGTGSTIAVNVKMVAPSKDEPNVEFVHATNMATLSLAPADPVGTAARGAFTSNFGATVKVDVVGTKGSGACDATISIDLVMKE